MCDAQRMLATCIYLGSLIFALVAALVVRWLVPSHLTHAARLLDLDILGRYSGSVCVRLVHL